MRLGGIQAQVTFSHAGFTQIKMPEVFRPDGRKISTNTLTNTTTEPTHKI